MNFYKKISCIFTDFLKIIFRYGFNSAGHEVVYSNLEKKSPKNKTNIVLGVNLGKNKTAVDPVADYVDGVKMFGHIADYLVVNISRYVDFIKLNCTVIYKTCSL